jgi:predicted dinucleotide-binding enzyme
MKIGIIGSGHIGGTLTRRFRELGHDVTVANSRGPGSLADLAEQTGAAPGTVAEAVDSEVVVVAVPLRAVPDLVSPDFAGRVVVDANNYYPQRDGRIGPIDAGTASSRWVADQLAGARVVKAFNTINYRQLGGSGKASGTPGRIGLPVAADDADAKRLVAGLVDDLGFDPVDAGQLDESWRQEPDTPVYGADRDAAGVRDGLAAARR